jgi:hypothetical protein
MNGGDYWIPAFAGMTTVVGSRAAPLQVQRLVVAEDAVFVEGDAAVA